MDHGARVQAGTPVRREARDDQGPAAAARRQADTDGTDLRSLHCEPPAAASFDTRCDNNNNNSLLLPAASFDSTHSFCPNGKTNHPAIATSLPYSCSPYGSSNNPNPGAA